jgi:hypothetical protein
MPRGKVLVKKRSGGDLDYPCVDNACSGEFQKPVAHCHGVDMYTDQNIEFVTMLYILMEKQIYGGVIRIRNDPINRI